MMTRTYPLMILVGNSHISGYGECEKQNQNKCTMLPTQNIMDDCDFNAFDIPTIFNFMMALGKATDSVDADAIKSSLTGKFWAYHFVALRKYPSCESVKKAWVVTACMVIYTTLIRASALSSLRLRLKQHMLWLHWKVKWKENFQLPCSHSCETRISFQQNMPKNPVTSQTSVCRPTQKLLIRDPDVYPLIWLLQL